MAKGLSREAITSVFGAVKLAVGELDEVFMCCGLASNF
jgi:hypothetical protein